MIIWFLKENKDWYLIHMIIYICGSKVEFSWRISLAASTKERECTMYIPVYPNSSRSSRMRFLQRDGMTTKKGPPMKKFFGPYRKTFQQKWDSKSQKGDCHALEKSSAASSLDEVSVFRKKGGPEAPATDKTDEWTAEKLVQISTKVMQRFVSTYTFICSEMLP